ncbi:FecCD family ABC transporter permease [Chitinimonas sp. PSY-7]|uniref:iron chelate uptake ABC transporter family permease subunit n=1 Tax=Chitinimonas sp. PSY-7 TaxID=3459088 RepID=UPI00403FF711
MRRRRQGQTVKERKPLSRQRLGFVIAALALLTLALLVTSLCIGSTAYRPWQLWQTTPDAQLARDVVLQLRLPRSLAALAIGGLLAIAGLSQQILLRNPMADPYVLGTSGGASVGALAALLLGAGSAMTSISAGVGALASTLLVFSLARHDHSSQQSRLLLTGIAVASFAGALSSLLLSIAPDGLLRGMVFWMLGDLAGAPWHIAAPALLMMLALLWSFARDLNILSHGQQAAYALGNHTSQLQWLLYFASSIATAVAVTSAGLIGFVGLIVPHALRLLLGQDLRLLLPATVFGGGCTLLAADIVSRTLLAPQQISVGVVTALAGVPVFLWLLQQRGGAR